jgi:hypothetical protein
MTREKGKKKMSKLTVGQVAKMSEKKPEPIYSPYVEMIRPHKCKCNNEGARTVRIVNELAYCPRCGGVVVNMPVEKLVPLDFELVKIFFQNRWTYLENEVGASTTTLEIYRELIKILQVVCFKFGTPPKRNMSREKLLAVLQEVHPHIVNRKLVDAILSAVIMEEKDG